MIPFSKKALDQMYDEAKAYSVGTCDDRYNAYYEAYSNGYIQAKEEAEFLVQALEQHSCCHTRGEDPCNVKEQIEFYRNAFRDRP